MHRDGAGDSVSADGSSHDKITLGNGNGDVVNDAGRGGNTMTVGNGNDTVFGGLNDTIAIGNGQNQLVAAPGDVWTVGSGQDTFAFNAGFGNNTITDFNTSRDVLQFNHALFVNFAAAMADTKQVGANTVITYDANDTVTLTGVAASHLTASNFKFP
jgi:Ca2+-binding RTX toxin-like protein